MAYIVYDKVSATLVRGEFPDVHAARAAASEAAAERPADQQPEFVVLDLAVGHPA